jgi:hypothetical protein
MSAPSANENLIGNSDPDALLDELFSRHFEGDGVAKRQQLDAYLKAIELPFKLFDQIRELKMPLQAGQKKELPSLIYYYVPDSGWGLHQSEVEHPTDNNFVYRADGVGLNMGCPVRLLRALDLMDTLPPDERIEPQRELGNRTKHLSTVEELLWLEGWGSADNLRRGGSLRGARGDVDWTFTVSGFPVFLEAKFRPSDWPRSIDNGTFIPIEWSFLRKAAHKFPEQPHDHGLHLVGITGYGNLTEDIVYMIGRELEQYPQIHGVVFRSFLQMTHAISLHEEVVAQTLEFIGTRQVRDYPTNYCFVFDHAQRDERVNIRRSNESTAEAREKPLVTCRSKTPRMDETVIDVENADYRLEIENVAPDGEPTYRVFPKSPPPDQE